MDLLNDLNSIRLFQYESFYLHHPYFMNVSCKILESVRKKKNLDLENLLLSAIAAISAMHHWGIRQF